ncbi:MAG: tryptophan halogenase [Gammaproteobacteria bacterium]|nr:MAG: tryptophan halogenase [Gammaproteobacteria bacterium]
MNTQAIKKIVIVGGGTAGWLAANHLAKNITSKQPDGVEVMLIESPNIPTIGVGEGTVPLMRQSLQALGISETEFITECDATFKQGIKFVNWQNNPIVDKPEYYHHAFDYPNLALTPYWLLHKSKHKNSHESATSFADAVTIQAKICDAGLAPKLITTPEYQGLTAYAYHLDAGKFATILTRNAVEKLGVQHLRAEVRSVNLADNGEIKSLNTDTLGEIEADFFVDCTGFKALLIGDALKVDFVDKSDVLFADHAVTIQIPYDNENAEIPSYTISTALECGWVWDIGLKQRRGIGHVYSSKYISHDQAEAQLRAYVGKAADGVNSRLIAMKIGYREKFWHKNCVALGLAQGFVEPLEATGLLVFDVTAKMLAEQFPSTKAEMPLVAQQFNKNVRKSWDNVIDFVKLHYCISQRNDSQFWLDNRDPNSIPETLKEQLERWKFQPPTQYDFASRFEIFNLENYLYVLYGMNYPTDISLIASRLTNIDNAQQEFTHIAEQAELATSRLPTNRALIEKIHQYGLQKN